MFLGRVFSAVKAKIDVPACCSLVTARIFSSPSRASESTMWCDTIHHNPAAATVQGDRPKKALSCAFLYPPLEEEKGRRRGREGRSFSSISYSPKTLPPSPSALGIPPLSPRPPFPLFKELNYETMC